MTLTVGSLFSGIGGLDLGLERAGMKVIWQSEIDPYATRVLNKHWPEVPNHGDIKRIDWRNIVRPDVICGGYPCQPFSLAGARKGEEDPRHLWPWVRHALSVLRPRYAILENVRGHLSLGGPTVISEITALGYCAEWRVISAASVGANHRRDRVFIVASPNGENESDAAVNVGRQEAVGMVADTDGSHSTDGRQRTPIPSENRSWGNDGGGGDSDPRKITVRGSGQDPGDVADTDGAGLERHIGSVSKARDDRRSTGSNSTLADTESGINVRRDGSRGEDRGEIFGRDNYERGTAGYAGWEWWETEPDVGRVAHGIPNRVDRLKGLGNAVVPQVAEIVGRLVINHYERTTT